MERHLRARFWLEAIAAVVSGVALGMTVAVPRWIEVLFGDDPDAGSGALEWTVLAILLAVLIVTSVLARLEWRARLPAHPPLEPGS